MATITEDYVMLKKKGFDEESKVNLEFEKYIEEQKRKLRSLIRF